MLTLNWNIFWIVFNIIVLFILLRIFLFKPLNNLAEKRRQLIEGQIEEADTKNKEATELKDRYEASLKGAKEESAQIISSAKERAQVQYNSIIDKANEDAAHIVEQANKAAESDREQILREAKAEIAEMALAAASKVIGSTVDGSSNKKLLDDFLAGEE
ncbi:MAG: F0F1 ATP synthase subunit B [Anaerovoracaceae bacterium]